MVLLTKRVLVLSFAFVFSVSVSLVQANPVIQAFTGGDPGEGLDMQGEFLYAIDVGGIGDEIVGDAEFTDWLDTPGALIFGDEQDGADLDLGDSPDDDALEVVMSTGRWSNPNALEGIDAELDVTPGQAYQLQLMFVEGWIATSEGIRVVDVFVDDELIVPDFDITEFAGVQDVTNGNGINDAGTVIQYQVTPESDTLLIGIEHGLIQNPRLEAITLEVLTDSTALQAGDANQDLNFNQLDIVQISVADKYLSGTSATWGEGDWNGAPGGEPGSPPPGDGFFDQVDIIAALSNGLYLTGPYGALAPGGEIDDEQTTLVYDANTGELSVDAPASTNLTSIFVTSEGNSFIGDKPPVLDGPFDSFGPDNIFKSTIGSSFGDISFGNVLPAALSESDVLADLTASGSLEGGGGLGDVDLVYIPEPSAIALLFAGIMMTVLTSKRHRFSR